MPKIFWASLDKTTEVKAGTSVLDAAIENDIPLNHACGGCCACTTCHIIVKEGMGNLSEAQEDELDLLESKQGVTLQSRLGCQSKVMGDITVEILPISR